MPVDLAMPFSSGYAPHGQKQQNRGFAFVKFSSHGAAARAHRAGSKSDFLIPGNCHPIVEWAEEPEVNPEELAKTKIAFVRNLPADADENYLKKLYDPLGKLDRVVVSKKGHYPAGFVHFAKRATPNRWKLQGLLKRIGSELMMILKANQAVRFQVKSKFRRMRRTSILLAVLNLELKNSSTQVLGRGTSSY